MRPSPKCSAAASPRAYACRVTPPPTGYPSPLVKPRLRGVSHQIACGVAAIAGAIMVLRAPAGSARLAAGVYALSLVGLLGISAAYHRPTWKPTARAWMRRLDHAAIFLLIAGTYTPFCRALAAHGGATIRTVVWCGALAGILQSIVWVKAPRPVSVVIYMALAWCVVPYIPRLYTAVGAWPLGLLLVGGLVYSVGAVIYARRRPDPVPAVFGYHEVFHALVIVAAALHFTAVALILVRTDGG